jgi:putative transposase
VTAEYHQRQQRIKGMRQRGGESPSGRGRERPHSASSGRAGVAAWQRLSPRTRYCTAVLAEMEEEEYSEDEYLNNSLDMLESNKRKNAI